MGDFAPVSGFNPDSVRIPKIAVSNWSPVKCGIPRLLSERIRADGTGGCV